jgi:hypothetical protein
LFVVQGVVADEKPVVFPILDPITDCRDTLCTPVRDFVPNGKETAGEQV